MDVDSIYLFGSRARGEGDIESDIDIAVVVKDRKVIKDVTRRVVDASIKIGEEMDISGELMLSPIVIEEPLLEGESRDWKKNQRRGGLVMVKEIAEEEKRSYITGTLSLSSQSQGL